MPGLTTASKVYKPFQYPWAMEYAEQHEKMHWGSWEAKLQEDVAQWKNKVISDKERAHITQILRIFTQSDVAVGGNYCDIFIPHFKNNEIRNMLLSFANREGTHQRSYALLNDTLGLAESEYSSFLNIKEMSDKINFMLETEYKPSDEAQALAFELARSVCNEGMCLFSAFVMLLNFQRFGKMKGMCEIVEWSLRDESCFTPDTELLTERGWVSFEELTEDIKVAQYNQDTQEINFVYPENYISKDYSGNLVNFKSDYLVNLTATEDHDLLYLHSYKEGLKPRKVKFSEFEPHYRKKIIKSGYKRSGTKSSLSTYEKFLIALQADGTIDYRINGKFCNHRVATFSLTKERKKQRLESILQELGWEYTISPKDSRFSYRVAIPLEFSISKIFDWVSLSDIDSAWAEEFLIELGHWDGHFVNNQENRITFVTTEPYNANVVQSIAVLCGWSCTHSIREDNRKETYLDCHVLNLNQDVTFFGTGNVEKTTYPYSGKVMCVSVPQGNIIVRQNNKVAVVGNCHVEAMTKLFHTYCEENPKLVTAQLKKYIYTNFTNAVAMEDALIDLLYENYESESLTADQVKAYIRYLADRRLIQLGLKPQFKQKNNPLEWLDWVVSGDSFKNFFEGTVTDYSANGLVGQIDWSVLGDSNENN
jgi:ribonucleotide reductase beta subunit family protein with ferritin-like domain